MSDDPRTRADARLEAALASAPFRDPRPYFRPILKHLREHDAAAFERALTHFESALVPMVAGEGDPIAAWLEYGRVLTTLAGDGRIMAVDGSGRAEPAGDSPDATSLLLYLPDAPETPAVVLRCPRAATPAQAASIELLVLGRVSVSDQLSAVGAQQSVSSGRASGLPTADG
ncbi:MAG TPA: hypothetical protein VMM12_18995 [Longimicrobiales bacterium]|nr:hypothetical protein [Longimicrobiales bacterium]